MVILTCVNLNMLCQHAICFNIPLRNTPCLPYPKVFWFVFWVSRINVKPWFDGYLCIGLNFFNSDAPLFEVYIFLSLVIYCFSFVLDSILCQQQAYLGTWHSISTACASSHFMWILDVTHNLITANQVIWRKLMHGHIWWYFELFLVFKTDMSFNVIDKDVLTFREYTWNRFFL